MPLSDVLHQEVAQGRLRRALSSRRVPHGYLFTGPPGVGKEMLATRLAQLLLCTDSVQNEDGHGLFGGADETNPQASGLKSEIRRGGPQASSDACGICDDCVLFAAGNHPDFHRIHRALNKMHPDKTIQRRKAIDLSVNVIRHFVLDRIILCPSRGQAKVFLILEADRLSIQAQNALLKTLEEPPGHSYLILLASAPDDLLPTTRSRCQQIPFGTLPDEFVMQQLARRNVVADHAAFVTQLAQGSLGSAIRYAEMNLLERAKQVVSAIDLSRDDPLAAGKALLDMAKDLNTGAKERDDEEQADTNAAREAQTLVISIASTILRDVQRAMVGSPLLALPSESVISKLAKAASTRALGQTIRAMGLAEYQIDQNANTSLVFDGLGIALGLAFGRELAAR